MQRLKRSARIIDPRYWPDSAAEDMLYWISRSPEERLEAGRELVRTTFRYLHGKPLPRMSKVGRVFQPEP